MSLPPSVPNFRHIVNRNPESRPHTGAICVSSDYLNHYQSFFMKSIDRPMTFIKKNRIVTFYL